MLQSNSVATHLAQIGVGDVIDTANELVVRHAKSGVAEVFCVGSGDDAEGSWVNTVEALVITAVTTKVSLVAGTEGVGESSVVVTAVKSEGADAVEILNRNGGDGGSLGKNHRDGANSCKYGSKFWH